MNAFPASIATRIIRDEMESFGMSLDDFAVVTRADDSVNVVGLNTDADRVLIALEDKLWEATAKAGSSFILEHVKGFPVLTNRHG